MALPSTRVGVDPSQIDYHGNVTGGSGENAFAREKDITKVQNMTADAYVEDGVYLEGELCIYDNVLWRAKVTNAVKPYVGDEWEVVTISDLLGKGGIGFIDTTNAKGISSGYVATDDCWVNIEVQATIQNYAGNIAKLMINGVMIFEFSYDFSSSLRQISYHGYTFPVKKGDTITWTGNFIGARVYGMKY